MPVPRGVRGLFDRSGAHGRRRTADRLKPEKSIVARSVSGDKAYAAIWFDKELLSTVNRFLKNDLKARPAPAGWLINLWLMWFDDYLWHWKWNGAELTVDSSPMGTENGYQLIVPFEHSAVLDRVCAKLSETFEIEVRQ